MNSSPKVKCNMLATAHCFKYREKMVDRQQYGLNDSVVANPRIMDWVVSTKKVEVRQDSLIRFYKVLSILAYNKNVLNQQGRNVYVKKKYWDIISRHFNARNPCIKKFKEEFAKYKFVIADSFNDPDFVPPFKMTACLSSDEIVIALEHSSMETKGFILKNSKKYIRYLLGIGVDKKTAVQLVLDYHNMGSHTNVFLSPVMFWEHLYEEKYVNHIKVEMFSSVFNDQRFLTRYDNECAKIDWSFVKSYVDIGLDHIKGEWPSDFWTMLNKTPKSEPLMLMINPPYIESVLDEMFAFLCELLTNHQDRQIDIHLCIPVWDDVYVAHKKSIDWFKEDFGFTMKRVNKRQKMLNGFVSKSTRIKYYDCHMST
jgi:hypothetical protein